MSFLQEYYFLFPEFIYDGQNAYFGHNQSGTQVFKLTPSATSLADMELFEDIVLQNPTGCYFTGGLYQLRRMLISFSPSVSSKLRSEQLWSHWFSGGKCHR